ncbi:KamA family radical SAM protein [Candidatus Peregrinibacteria bacterium]|nr:KamA family radical SAM protein [Candidatus Peregrinibacteria bacterium]
MSLLDAYKQRPQHFQKIERGQWENWMWQQQNAVRTGLQLRKMFPNLPSNFVERVEVWEKKGFRFQVTPYVLSLMRYDEQGNFLLDDPIARQVFPLQVWDHSQRPDEYGSEKENWENSEEMISPIAQHKYDNRVIIYTADACLGYCVYCFRSLQSNAVEEKHGGRPHWKETIAAIQKLPHVEEVILSGGDPLLYDNRGVEEMLSDIRSITHIKAIRIHTRAWMHNPYRIDEEFCALLKKYRVTEMGVHLIHPRELTVELDAAVSRVRCSDARTMLMTDTPLLRGINNNTEILHELFMGMYTMGIKPYYFSHCMPNVPAADVQRTSVKEGARLMQSLKRKISNVAMPEYIITSRLGKKTVPEALDGGPEFCYEKDDNGYPIIRFVNWKGEWETYLDAPEENVA